MEYFFYALVALLAGLLTAAVLWPLRKASPRLFGGLVPLVAALTLGLYALIGTPAALDPDAMSRDGMTPASLDEAVASLRAELETNPAQPEGWMLLGRSYTMMERHAEARDAFAEALKLVPDDAALLVEAAQSRAQADPQHRFDDDGLAMLRKALQIDPASQRAAWFIGIAQRQRGDDAGAVATWEALLPRVDAQTATALRGQIDAAREAAEMSPLPAATVPAPETDATATDDTVPARGLRVRVSLDPDFAARVRLRGDATVFVIARLPDGPPMPVAVERHTLQDLPLDIVLDDNDSPMPTQKLSSLGEVEVFARMSASGDAGQQEGNLDSAPVRVALPAQAPVDLVIGK